MTDQGLKAEKNTSLLLSNEQLQFAVVTVVKSFDIEVARLLDEIKLKKVIEKFTNLYYETDLFSFFVGVNLTEMTRTIFEDGVYRAFVLNMTDRVSLEWASQDFSTDPGLIHTLTEAVCKNKPVFGSGKSLINKEVLQSLQVNPEVLSGILRDNLWLTVLYLLLVNYQQTTVFENLHSSKK